MKQPFGGGSRKQVSTTRSIPAPVKGWNTRDSIAEMDPLFAPVMKNWYSNGTSIAIRGGSEDHATGLPDEVNTLIVYNGTSANKLFAISDDSIYDVTSSGAVGAAVLGSLNSDKFQYVQFSTLGGLYVIAVSGSDTPLKYDGSTWSTTTITGSGLTASNLIHVTSFKEKLFFVEKDSMNAWYLATGAIAGAASKLDFSTVFKRGGYLNAIGTWSIDGGQGLDDHIVFVSSKGEVAVYQGTDPASATSWALIGVFQSGSPIGRRCLVQIGGDVALICKDGLTPLSQSLLTARMTNKSALTDVIAPTVSAATQAYENQFGWEAIVYPPEDMVLLNVPITDGTEQYVLNTITGAWSQFTGWDANCFAFFNEELYFGGTEVVTKAYTGTSDNGSNIETDCIQAFNSFGSSSQLKQFRMARPLYTTTGNPGVRIGVNIDYEINDYLAVQTIVSAPTAEWDSGIWDQDIWGGVSTVQKDWQWVSGLGYSASVRFKTSSDDAQINWLASDFVMEFGGVL